MTPPRSPEAAFSGALPMSSPSVAERRALSPSRGVPLLRAARRAVARLPHAAGSGTAGTFHSFWIALAGRIGKQERAAPTGDPLKNEEEMSMLNLIKNHRAEQEEPMFSAAHTSDARRAQAWLEAQFRRAEKGGGFTMDDVKITPVLAEVLLTANTNNRPITRAHVDTLDCTLTEGRWIPGARTIRFDSNRTLADGQHALTAVIQAGMPAVMDVRFGVLPEARDVMDSGRTRRAGDILGLRQYRNATDLASSGRLLRNIKRGVNLKNSKLTKMDNDQVRDFVADHPQLEESVSVAKAVGKTIKVGSSPIAVAHYLIVESGAPDAAVADFFEVVRTGLGLTKKGDARYVLREFFRDGSFRNLSGPASHTAILSAVILAWNAFKADRRARTVKIDPGATIPAVEAW
jgi:hypothetical protein